MLSAMRPRSSCQNIIFVLIAALGNSRICIPSVGAFSPIAPTSVGSGSDLERRWPRPGSPGGIPLFAEEAAGSADGNGEPTDTAPVDVASAALATAEIAAEREGLKRSLLKLGASYDRGYGATSSSREEARRIIERLEEVNPTIDAARGISGDGPPAPLEGVWRMVWTTAQDVLTLASSPFATVGGIYQVIDPPVATNVIDLIPRAQALLPPGVAPPTLVRAEVTTRASPRPGKPLRVGLVFESVKVRPVEVLGVATDGVLPPLSIPLPRIDIQDLPGVDPAESPGFFDVAYLDDEMLVIKQNAPGGVFALIKTDSYDP